MKAIYVTDNWVKVYGDFPEPVSENFKEEFVKAFADAVPFKDQDLIEDLIYGDRSEESTLYPIPADTEIVVEDGYAIIKA